MKIDAKIPQDFEEKPRKARRGETRDPDFYVDEARKIIRATLARNGMTYKQLAKRLNPTNDTAGDTEHSLQAKVKRGRFSFAFFLRVTQALNVSTVNVEATRIPPRKTYRS